jgi:hypothetical protein
MKPFSVHPIVKEGFSISARHEGYAIFLKIIGNGDMETPITLGGYLKKVHTEALRLRAHHVIIECDELYFLSSACVKCLVTWVDGIMKLEPADRYKVKLKANAHLPWQRRSFEALRRFAPSLVHIDSDSTQTPSAPQSPAAPMAAAKPPSSASLQQAAKWPASGTVAQSATISQAPAAPRSATVPQASTPPKSATMPQLSTVPQTPAARRKV